MRSAATSPTDAAPQVASSPSAGARVDGIVGAEPVHRASQNRGKGRPAAVVDVVEEPLVHHLTTVPLLVIPAQILRLCSELSRQGRDLGLLHVGKQGLSERGGEGLQEFPWVHWSSWIHLKIEWSWRTLMRTFQLQECWIPAQRFSVAAPASAAQEPPPGCSGAEQPRTLG